MCDLNLQREWVIFHQVRTCSSISWWQQVTFRHNRPLGHSILVPRHPALTQQSTQTHYPRSETSGTDTTVYSDTLSSFRDNSPLRHIILVPSSLRHIILVPSPLKHIILVPRHPALTQQSTQTHYPRSETSSTDTTVHSDTLSSFRDIRHWDNSPLRHIILVPRQQSTQTDYLRSETSGTYTTVHLDTLSSFPVH